MSKTEIQPEETSGKEILRWIIMPFAASFAQMLAFLPLVFVCLIALIGGKAFSLGAFLLGMPFALFFSGYLYTAAVIRFSPNHKKNAALIMLGISAILGFINIVLSLISINRNVTEGSDIGNFIVQISLVAVAGFLTNLSGSYYKYRKAFSVNGLF